VYFIPGVIVDEITTSQGLQYFVAYVYYFLPNMVSRIILAFHNGSNSISTLAENSRCKLVSGEWLCRNSTALWSSIAQERHLLLPVHYFYCVVYYL